MCVCVVGVYSHYTGVNIPLANIITSWLQAGPPDVGGALRGEIMEGEASSALGVLGLGGSTEDLMEASSGMGRSGSRT